jgi:hypothetical protein
LLGVDQGGEVTLDLGQRGSLSRIGSRGRRLVAADLHDRRLGGRVLTAESRAGVSQLMGKGAQLPDGIALDRRDRSRVRLPSEQLVGTLGALQRDGGSPAAQEVGLDPLSAENRAGGGEPSARCRDLTLRACELGRHPVGVDVSAVQLLGQLRQPDRLAVQFPGDLGGLSLFVCYWGICRGTGRGARGHPGAGRPEDEEGDDRDGENPACRPPTDSAMTVHWLHGRLLAAA